MFYKLYNIQTAVRAFQIVGNPSGDERAPIPIQSVMNLLQ